MKAFMLVRLRHAWIWATPPLAILACWGYRLLANRTGETLDRPLTVTAAKAFSRGDFAVAELGRALINSEPDRTFRDVPVTLHQLRVWGTASDYRSRAIACLLDNQLFVDTFHSPRPWIVKTRSGARFAEKYTQDPSAGALYEPHPGYMLSVFAEMGLPLSQVIRTNQGRSRLKDVLDDLMANYRGNLDEPDWSLIALALYLPPQAQWTNKFEDRFSFDSEISKVLGRPLGEGTACRGTHTLQTLSIVLQADHQRLVLAAPTRDGVRAYLERARAQVIDSQEPDGSWNVYWSERRGRDGVGHEPDDEVHITGHILEWLAIMPPDLRIPRDRMERALTYACRRIAQADPGKISQRPCQFLHALRAACLLSGVDPTESGIHGGHHDERSRQ